MMLEDGRRARRLAEKRSQGWGRKKADPAISAPADLPAGNVDLVESEPFAGLFEAPAAAVPAEAAAPTFAVESSEPTFTDLVRVVTPDASPPVVSPLADEAHDATVALPIQNQTVAFPEVGSKSLDSVPTTALALLDEPAAPTSALAVQEEPAPKPRPKQRVSIVGVFGEIFITAGVLVLAFLGWQVWLNDIIVGNEQQQQAEVLSESWDRGEGTAPAPIDRPDPGEPLVVAAPANAVDFATLIVPRFGVDWEKPVAEGVGLHDVLNSGIGHYPGTQMPGEVGNAAFAAHRTGWGAPFGDIGNLQIGDSIYLETADGWYRYVFRSFEYVMPTGVDVLSPVPQVPEAAAGDRIITLTSCNPKTTAAERIIAYGVYDTWYPRDGGPPPEIAPVVATATVG